MNIKNMLLGYITQDDLLNYYNATVIYVDIFYENIRGFVDYYNGIYYIYINRFISNYKRKKTLLHELAHIELNQLCQIDKDLFDFHINQYEDEANIYIKKIKEEIEYEYIYKGEFIC